MSEQDAKASQQVDPEITEWIEEGRQQQGTSGFFAAVSRYYAQFLDTDFKKSRLPKRRLENKDKKNRRRGVPLKKYPGFESKVWAGVQKSIGDGYRFSIAKGTYTAKLPATTINAVSGQIKVLARDDFQADLNKLKDRAVQKSASKPDPELFREKLFEELRLILVRKTVAPLLERLDAAVSAASSPIERLVELEDELSAYLIDPMLDESGEAITSLIVEKAVEPLDQLLDDYLSTETLQSRLSEFFEDFSAGDLFLDLREMIAVEQLGENDEFYLHLGEIHYKNHAFPLFYLPLSVELNGATIELKTEPHLFVNKKALDYVSDDLKRIEPSYSPFLIKDRLIYLDSSDKVVDKLEEVLSPVLVSLSLTGDSGDVDFRTTRLSEAKSSRIRINNRISVSLFDQSDESMVNDYEALLTGLEGGGEVVKFFEELVDQFLIGNPESIIQEVNSNWEETSVSDRLVFESPLPLAEEQRKILNAISHKNGRFILVEGPPGTGKSHTIAAIAFHQILSGRNLLILSDKKEALDVVERFLNDVLVQVRQDDDFQNPILRLGKAGSNFVKLVKPATLQKIETNVRVAKSKEKALVAEHDAIAEGLKTGLSETAESFRNIALSDIAEYHQEEAELVADYPDLEEDFDEERELELITDLFVFREYVQRDAVLVDELFDHSGWELEDLRRVFDLAWKLDELPTPRDIESKIPILTRDQIHLLEKASHDVRAAKGVFGYLFAGGELKRISHYLSKVFPQLKLDLKRESRFLSRVVELSREIDERVKPSGQENDEFSLAYFLAVRKRLEKPSAKEKSSFDRLYKAIIEREFPLDIESDLRSVLVEEDTDMADFLERASRLYEKRKTLAKAFQAAPELDYLGKKKQLEALNAQKLANLIDKRVIEFSHQSPADAKTLAKIVKNKSKFPTDKFEVLKKAFPCIIAGLRDYAEFIPLERDLFDLVIIDEGSQVSIAQAWPAVLRAKKMLVLGDRKQFSNVKTSNASKEINSAYMRHVLEEFDAHFSETDESAKERAKIFDIKSSVMDFFGMVANYQIMLRKHFRSYPELISFSSKFFYEEALQPLKVRAKSIDEVIEFCEIEHDGKLDLTKNTNELEAKHILGELEKLIELEDPPSVAVITPHSEQQTLMSRMVTDHERSEDLNKKLRLRIFTFDTCQGEERDVVYYSLVATREKDRLGGIFLRSIERIDDDELDGSVRLQRLNVGFSRAKEKIVIVHSKPVEEFNNSIKTALQHYKRVLKNAKDMPTVDEVDPNSPMEGQLLNWLIATPFIQKLQGEQGVEILPQFEIGKYLKSLDPTYTHPGYRADFLIRVRDDDATHSVIVEYDGFQYHFESHSDVDSGNWEQYLTESDVEREKVLESFGYKMLRVNRFNLGKDEVKTLDRRLKQLFGDLIKSQQQHELISEIASTSAEHSEGLKEKTHKLCSKCNEIRPIKSFDNPENKSGKSRYCVECRESTRSTSRKGRVKSRKKNAYSSLSSTELEAKAPSCPSGHGKLVLREGTYGQFYGCSRFPRCRQTARIR